MNKKELLAAKALRQQELVDAAKRESRDLTAGEQAEFDRLQSEIEELTRQTEAENGFPKEPDGSEQNRTRQLVEDAIAAERQRVATITALCRDFGIDPDRYLSEGKSPDETRAGILEHLRQSKKPLTARISVEETGEDEFRRDAAEGMVLRGGLTPEGVHEGARQFAAMSLRDLAIECLEREGMAGARRMSSDELFSEMQRQYYNPTSAFPAILDSAIEKAYVTGHKQVPVTFDRWTRKGTLSDFKRHDNNYLAGPIGDFEEVPEGGELKHDRPVDAQLPTRQLKTYGKQFTLSRQAFINDDIGLVTSIPARHAAAARRTINRQCYGFLMKNPKIYDGKALFGGDHKNLLNKGTGITKEAVQAMIMAISTQKDQFGQAITIRPAMLVLPVGLGFDLFTLFNSPTIQTADNTQAVNPLYRYGLEQVEDPEINRLAGEGNPVPWFMLGAVEDTAFMEVDYLNGQEVPTIRRMETAGQLGFVWDVYLDWGISVMDFRGAVKNPGEKIVNTLLA